MPPRFAYWTILIDSAPTAFRAREQADLLPTLRQLRRTHPNVVLRWFAQGRLWESPEAARESRTRRPEDAERRGWEWRPGGQHRDPRMRRRPPGGPGKPERPAEPGRKAGGAGRSERRGGPHAQKPWDKPRPQGADRDRRQHSGGQGDGRSHHRQPDARVHGEAHRPSSHDRHRPPDRGDRQSQEARPKRDSDRRPVGKPKPEGGKKGFPKPQWRAHDRKGRPVPQRRSSWTPKRRPQGASHKPTDSEASRRRSEDPTQKPPKPPDDASGD